MSNPMHGALRAPAAALLLALPVAAQDWPRSIPADGGEPQTTGSGLTYSVLQEGRGERSPSMGDRVTVRYSGWLADSEELFDSSERKGPGATANFVVGRLIPGWNEALQMMRPGARYKLTVPPELGYGEDGSGETIPAGATLVFVVELVGFETAPEFAPVEGEAVRTTEGGVRYLVEERGEGETPAEGDIVELAYALWNRDGRLIDGTIRSGRTIEGACSDMIPPFLQEVPRLMPVGSVVRVHATQEQAFPDGIPPAFGAVPDGVTVWWLEQREVRTPLPVPEFRMPADDELTATDSGLRYRVLEEGSGESPVPGAAVRCHYAGWLADGTPFGSSYERAEPIEIEVGGRAIAGWNEALALMKPGARWLLVIPPELGYGEQGSPPRIPGGATLVYQVELLPAPVPGDGEDG